MSKTIEEWICMLPEPYRGKALKNIAGSPVASKIKETDFGTALVRAFSWNFSPEGYDYWNHVCDTYRNMGNPAVSAHELATTLINREFINEGIELDPSGMDILALELIITVILRNGSTTIESITDDDAVQDYLTNLASHKKMIYRVNSRI